MVGFLIILGFFPKKQKLFRKIRLLCFDMPKKFIFKKYFSKN